MKYQEYIKCIKMFAWFWWVQDFTLNSDFVAVSAYVVSIPKLNFDFSEISTNIPLFFHAAEVAVTVLTLIDSLTLLKSFVIR